MLSLPIYQSTIDNGFLKHKAKIVIGPDYNWRHKIFEEHHYTLMVGHEGVQKTYHRLKISFYWVGMKKDIKS